MNLLTEIPLLNQILDKYKLVIGQDFTAYKNHCYRVLNYANQLSQKKQIALNLNDMAVALAFHDLGLWANRTLDYIGPSLALAQQFIREHNAAHGKNIVSLLLNEKLILEMIDNHHKITPYRQNALVELFRQADMVDLTLGAIKHGLAPEIQKQIQKAFPNAGFHALLLKMSLQQLIKDPSNLLPMVRW